MSKPLSLGLLAASRIATQAVVNPAATVDGVEIAAVASRSAERAAEAADRWGADRSFGSYEELLESDVDAVYVATPAALHRQWAVATLKAGKHLLLEKPLASNAADGAMIAAAAEEAAADGVVAMEAFHWRYHPYVGQIRSVLESGVLGSIQQVSTRFDIEDGRIPRSDIRWDLALGGGALMDLGCYNVSWLRFVGHVLGLGEPDVVSASAVCPVDGVDGQLEAELAWTKPEDGSVTGRLHTSMIADFSEREYADEEVNNGHVTNLVVHGEEGTMKAVNPLSPHNGASLSIETGDGTEMMEPSGNTTYHHQLVAFRDAIDNGVSFPTTISDGVKNMAVIDACYQAAGLDVRPFAN